MQGLGCGVRGVERLAGQIVRGEEKELPELFLQRHGLQIRPGLLRRAVIGRAGRFRLGLGLGLGLGFRLRFRFRFGCRLGLRLGLFRFRFSGSVRSRGRALQRNEPVQTTTARQTAVRRTQTMALRIFMVMTSRAVGEK